MAFDLIIIVNYKSNNIIMSLAELLGQFFALELDQFTDDYKNGKVGHPKYFSGYTLLFYHNSLGIFPVLAPEHSK